MNKPKSRSRRFEKAMESSSAWVDISRSVPPGWMDYTARLQEETMYFIGTCLGRCLEMMNRFADCRTLTDVVDTQSRFVGDLLVEFADEGTLMVSKLCEPLSDARMAHCGNNAVS